MQADWLWAPFMPISILLHVSSADDVGAITSGIKEVIYDLSLDGQLLLL